MAMMSLSWVGLLVAAAAALLLAGLITGLVLLIIGLVRRRRGVWIGGLVTLLVALGLMSGVGVLALLAMG